MKIDQPIRQRLIVGVTVALSLGLLVACGTTSKPTAGPNSGSTPLVKTAVAACPQAGEQTTASKALPALTLPCLADSATVDLRKLTGKPTVVNLWASWCGPCRTELPAFQQLYQAAGDQVRVLGVVTEDPVKSRPLSLADDLGVHFPSVVDDHGEVRRAIGVNGLPATIFLSAQGKIMHVYNGKPLSFADLRGLVADHLQVTVDG